MTIGERIREKRESMGMTQEDLAFKLGYAGRSSVNKVENSEEVSMKKVKMYAEALNTSVAYLMGWEEPDYLYSDENAEFIIEVTKKADDKAFVDRISKYMSLMNEDKKSVDDMIDFLYNKEQKIVWKMKF